MRTDQLRGASKASMAHAQARWVKYLEQRVSGRHGMAHALTISDEVFAFSDALAESVALRRFCADPAVPAEAKKRLLRDLLPAATDPATIAELEAAVAADWASERDMRAAVEQLGMQAVVAGIRTQRAGALVENQLLQLRAELQASPEAVSFLMNSDYPLPARQELVEKLLTAQNANPATIAFARRAVANFASGHFMRNIGEAIEQLGASRGVTVANVASSVELSERQSKRLEKILTEKLGKPIAAFVTVDDSLIGGLRIEVDGRVIDNSVRSQLYDAGQHLLRSGNELMNV